MVKIGWTGIGFAALAACVVAWSISLQIAAAARPDLISLLVCKDITATDIASLEILLPLQSHAFTAAEYDALPRALVIADKQRISDCVARLTNRNSARIWGIHPSTVYRRHWKVKLSNGDYFYLHVQVIRDSSGSICYIDANSRNCDNPTYTVRYHSDESLVKTVDTTIDKL